MNDKQQLAAMGEHMAEQSGQKLLLCMAKRIEELEEQARVMAGLLRDAHRFIGESIPHTISEHYRGCDLLDSIDAALAGKLPEPTSHWIPISTAPSDGREALVYRPLAERSGDRPIAIKRLTGKGTCCGSTVPEGHEPCNPTDGSCHVTHWMPLVPPPEMEDK